MTSLQARVAKLNELDAKPKGYDYPNVYEHVQALLRHDTNIAHQFPTAIQALNEAMALLREAGEALGWYAERARYNNHTVSGCGGYETQNPALLDAGKRATAMISKLRNAGVIV